MVSSEYPQYAVIHIFVNEMAYLLVYWQANLADRCMQKDANVGCTGYRYLRMTILYSL